MNLPKVSVIIPVHNGEGTIAKCLSSILNQTYKDYELIIVDNNSTDDTRKIIFSFIKRFPRIKYVFEPRLSRGAARNAGIRESEGKIIAMTDSDCIVPPDWIRNITSPIITKKEKVVQGSELNGINNFWSKNMHKSHIDFLKSASEYGYINHIDTKNIAIESILLKSIMFNPHFVSAEDYEFYLRLKDLSRILFIPDIKVVHLHRFSFADVIKTQFCRAYFTKKTENASKHIKSQPKHMKLSLSNLILFLENLLVELIKRPFKELFFITISRVAWLTGIWWYCLSPN